MSGGFLVTLLRFEDEVVGGISVDIIINSQVSLLNPIMSRSSRRHS